MAKTKGCQVTLHGRFRPGTRVRLVKVAHEGVLRAEGGEEVAVETVDEAGRVQFTEGVEVGARYFIVGQLDGAPLEVRARGNVADDENSVLATAPVQPDPQKLADGTLASDVVLPGSPRQAPEHPVTEKAAPKRAAGKRAPARKPAGKAPASRAKTKSTTAKTSARGSARKG